MSREIRILHLADSHIGAQWPERPRSGAPRRGDDFIASYRRALRIAATQNVDLVIHAGDVFDRPRPGQGAIAAAGQPLLELAAGGIPVVVLPGNHERSAIPESIWFCHPNLHVVREPVTLTFRLRDTRVGVSAAPCVRRSSATLYPPAIEQTGWREAAADIRILALHQTLESATCGPGNFRFRSDENVVERGAIPAEFHYVAAGHVHRHQQLAHPAADGPPLVYCGSPDRISFAEKDEPKGAVLVTFDGGRARPEFVEHAVRPMVLLPIDVSGLDAAQVAERTFAAVAEAPISAVVQVRLTGTLARGVLEQVRFSAPLRALRPDLLVTVTTRTVERSAAAASGAPRGGRSVLAPEAHAYAEYSQSMPPPSESTLPEVLRCAVADVARVPTAPGVYALYNVDGGLLYIGKARNLRARVRTHVGGRADAQFFAGWTRQIAQIETRLTGGDIESLVLEADLIRRHRPPFNRQMRFWSRYSYLVAGDELGSLAVAPQPAGRMAFGPFGGRSACEQVADAVAAYFGTAQCPEPASAGAHLPGLREATRLCERYFDGRCCGPCARRVEPALYENRLRARDALLAGESDALLRVTEAWLADRDPDAEADPEIERLRAQAGVLRWAFDRAALLREACDILGGLLVLPGPAGGRSVIVPGPGGVQVLPLSAENGSAERILARRASPVRSGPGRPFRVPRQLVDVYITLARALRRGGEDLLLVRPAAAARLSAAELVALAFGPAPPARLQYPA